MTDVLQKGRTLTQFGFSVLRHRSADYVEISRLHSLSSRVLIIEIVYGVLGHHSENPKLERQIDT
jgi:hypothetical protein